MDINQDDRNQLETIGVYVDGERLSILVDAANRILELSDQDEYVYGDLRIECSEEGALVIFRRAIHGSKEREILLRSAPIENELEVTSFHRGAWIDLLMALDEAVSRGVSPDDLTDLRNRFNPCPKTDSAHRYEDDLLWPLIQERANK
ncbi:MAG: hypothetical protein P9L94_10985 [Candidatus Hinthialibacter antarcticus]|nr:hypothetical protein [Candidatus Hinthialibacter antarcticus]